MESLKELLTPYIKSQLDKKLENVTNPIFVFIGIEQYVDISMFESYIADKETFLLNGNDRVFTTAWFAKVFNLLVSPQTSNKYTILSFPQFSYLINYIQPSIFEDRLIIVQDGFRSLLPLNRKEYIETTIQENIEERAKEMPIYMAEQFLIEGNYYYSIKTLLDDFSTLYIFNEQKKLELLSDDNCHKVIDIVSDPHGIDVFINSCLAEGTFEGKSIIVKLFKKQPMNESVKAMLEKINWLLSQFGSQIFELDESEIDKNYQASNETITLLHQYWGQDASFRTLRVYKNPDYNKEIVDISQGLIVETIINEYKKSKTNEETRDLFLTAPTGAGKSLLFQLPAFFVSSQGDVTIIVSPLIALMKDQVEQIKTDRGFAKVCYINSELSLIDRDRVIDYCKNGEIDVIYLSPELLLSYDIKFFIGERKLGLLVVDEAHLITTWGRDFRVDYWFLGQHINKIRKNNNYRFPMVAVTATAIYGGENDMVFDSVNSLYMHNPHIYIGEVKRNNITFVINNHDRYKGRYDDAKLNETVSFIERIAEEGVKTIVYAPYKKQISNIINHLHNNENNNIAVAYHSDITADAKTLAYQRFKSNQTKVMVATKAFGMGVDIPDIQLVYHHAPSGLLPDYVQEVGRAARIPSMKGFAALNYAVEDQRYSKTLYGMSALRHYQLREVLNKIHKIYKANNDQRNMLVSSDDFSYIFDNSLDIEQKVMTSLMMIEKDYLAKYRFNVLIARPKKLFVKVYCMVNRLGVNLLSIDHPGCFTKIFDKTNDYSIVELDLDKIWRLKFSDRSFPLIKRAFYEGTLFTGDLIDVRPQIKVIFTITEDYNTIYNKLESTLNAIQIFFDNISGFFTELDFDKSLSKYFSSDILRKKIITFILTTYSDKYKGVDNDAFLQSRRSSTQKVTYRIINRLYANKFATLKRRFVNIFGNGMRGNTSSTFSSHNSQYLIENIRLGSLLELLGVGAYETRGGEKPMIFIRINDPRRIERDAKNADYKNSLLSSIENRHKSSSDIFDHFFLNSFSNEERWRFIEDFFLGESNEELFAKYPDNGNRNHIDIIQFVKIHNSGENILIDNLAKDIKDILEFPPRESGRYSGSDLLTLDKITHSINEWLMENPVELDKARKKFSLILHPDVYTVLVSKLKTEHFSYYRDSLGLNLVLSFPGYNNPVKALVPYCENPVKFYKWFRKNEDKVYLTKKDYIQLLVNVNNIKPDALVKKDREILKNKKA